MKNSAGEIKAAGTDLDLLSLRRVFGKFSTGVTIVTADANGRPVGMTCNSFASLSLEPPLLLWSLRKASSSYNEFANAEFFAVNILASDQIELSGKFAKSGTDKFAGVSFERGHGDSPLLPGTTANFECQVETTHDGGDHLIVIGRIIRFSQSERPPLVFSDGRYVDTIERQAAKVPANNAMEAATGDPLHQYVSVLLLRAFHRVLDHLAEARQEIGVTVNESRLLTVASAYPNRTLESLMPYAYMAASAMEDALRTLQLRGYLSADQDGRIAVTETGLAKVQSYNAKFAALEAHLFRKLSGEQVEFFRGVLMDIMKSEPLQAGSAR